MRGGARGVWRTPAPAQGPSAHLAQLSHALLERRVVHAYVLAAFCVHLADRDRVEKAVAAPLYLLDAHSDRLVDDRVRMRIPAIALSTAERPLLAQTVHGRVSRRAVARAHARFLRRAAAARLPRAHGHRVGGEQA